MNKTLKLTLIVIGILGLTAGIYLAVTGADFIEYFSGIFCGALLIVSGLSKKKQVDTNNKT